MLDIIGIGESDIDIYLKVDHPPGRGEKVRAEEIGKLPGGMIGNFCSGAVKHGVKCGIVTVLGDDENGQLALEDYKNRGIDITGLTVKPGEQTFYCVVFIDPSGEKSLTTVVTKLISPALEDIDFNYVKTAKYVHMNSMDYTLVHYVADNLLGSQTRISLDYEAHAEKPGFASWKPILEKTAILFINEDGIKSLIPDLEMQAAAKKILQLGVEYVVVTCAEKGGFVFVSGETYSYKAYKVEHLVDTTGAGDCFNAAFLSSIIQNNSIEDSMRYAAAAAALSIQKIGARTGQPTRNEVEDFLAGGPETI